MIAYNLIYQGLLARKEDKISSKGKRRNKWKRKKRKK